MINEKLSAWYLDYFNYSDEIVLDEGAYLELKKFRDSVVGDDINRISDVIWSKTVPLKDLVLTVDGVRIRVCIFEEAFKELDEFPFGETMLIGAIQELENKTFHMIGVVKDEGLGMTFSDTYFSEKGEELGDSRINEELSEVLKLWHSVQLALLHPKMKEVFSSFKNVKESTRKRVDGKRKRVTWYVKRHYLDDREIVKSVKEINWKCKAWYVIGHFRHLKNGKVVYVKGYWKGEMRALKQNLDSGRERRVI